MPPDDESDDDSDDDSGAFGGFDQIEEDDKLSFLGLADLAPGQPVYAEIVKPDGTKIPFEANHTLNDEQIGWFRAGGALNIIRQRQQEVRG